MMQRLLDERFKLSLHRESKEFTVYALVVGKKSETPPGCGAGG
jgi:uncharacterized protein (TIGR03435 family)